MGLADGVGLADGAWKNAHAAGPAHEHHRGHGDHERGGHGHAEQVVADRQGPAVPAPLPPRGKLGDDRVEHPIREDGQVVAEQRPERSLGVVFGGHSAASPTYARSSASRAARNAFIA